MADTTPASSPPNPNEEAALRAEMRREADTSVMGIGLGGPQTAEMAKGRAVGIPISIFIGWVIAVPLALLLMGGLPVITKILAGLLVGFVFGVAVGLVAGGRLNPGYNREGDHIPGERDHHAV
jgi:hypothetical protein